MIVMLAGAVNVALFVGPVMATAGGVFGLTTVTLTGLEVVVAP